MIPGPIVNVRVRLIVSTSSGGTYTRNAPTDQREFNAPVIAVDSLLMYNTKSPKGAFPGSTYVYKGTS
jgi:hypothetical protein